MASNGTNGTNGSDSSHRSGVLSGSLQPQEGHISGMFSEWFLDYASYVILERAVPHVDDGLKPVQRRILHAMRQIDDGRYNKAANIIGDSMKYHPHGDASIGDALVQLGQRDLLIDTQGNWGNLHTGDSAAAPRYIEARLSKFALEVAFNPKTTNWQASYDGRNREPVTLPMKFPLLLAQGVEGIAVGLACKILPHNFNELIDASIAHLRGEEFDLIPDFPTGGSADFSNYQGGLRGGKIKVRADIEKRSRLLLVITAIPFGTTTTSLIDSILAANDKGKIKIAKVEDNTAENVEILVHLPSGSDADQAIEALYAFSDCELTISPNAGVIDGNKPRFLSVNDLLRRATGNTRNLLKLELEIALGELEEKWHFFSLEKIFIENRIYRRIEECTTFEAVIEEIRIGLEPFIQPLKREVTRDDILALTEIKIKRISKYDSFKADKAIKDLEKEISGVKKNLRHLTDFAISYYQRLKDTYGKGRERKTRSASFGRIIASAVVLANETLYVNRAEGFAGYGMKKDEAIEKCSVLDDVIVFLPDGTMTVQRVADKSFIGKDPLHVAILKKDDETVYNMIYRDGKNGPTMAKRFRVGGVTRDKVYDLTRGTPGSKVLYLKIAQDETTENVTVTLRPTAPARKKIFDFDLRLLAVKGRSAQGNRITQHPVQKITRSRDQEAPQPDPELGLDVPS
jgi:topoisomerase IV subunit A